MLLLFAALLAEVVSATTSSSQYQKFGISAMEARSLWKNKNQQSVTTFSTLDSSMRCDEFSPPLSPREVHYVIGEASQEGSTYATCSKDNQLACFVETGFMDRPAKPISCSSLIKSQTLNRRLRQAGVYVSNEFNGRPTDFLWTLGAVCFVIDTETYSEDQVNEILRAMLKIESQSNVRFVPREDCQSQLNDGNTDICNRCQNFAVIMPDSESPGCFSNVAMVGGAQFLVLNDDCFGGYNFHVEVAAGAVAVHELGHTLGLFHEHQHIDNDLLFLWDNIPPSTVSNYLPVEGPFIARTSYDRSSLMHYSEYFPNVPISRSARLLCIRQATCTSSSDSASSCIPESTNFCGAFDSPFFDQCVNPVESFCAPFDSTLGQQVRLSDGDIATLEQMYPEAFTSDSFLPDDVPDAVVNEPVFGDSPNDLSHSSPMVFGSMFNRILAALSCLSFCLMLTI